MQQIVKALIEKRGMPPGKAYAIARGAIRKWMRGGGHVHPEVVAASARAESGELAKQARAHAHTAGWEVADALVELATTIDLFNPYHAPTGQFTTAQGAGQGKGKQQAARRDRKADRPQRAALVRKIAGIRAQLASLEAQLRAATSTRRPSTKRPGAKSKTATPAKKGAGKTSAAAARKGKTAARRSVSPATLRGQIAALRATLQADLAQLRHL